MSELSGITSASNIQMDYMKLLITQLQNQNPLEPLNNNEMATQLAQFSQLSQLEQMNTNFAEVMKTTNNNYANSLLGKKVTFYEQDGETGTMEKRVGVVDSIFKDPETSENLLGVSLLGSDPPQEYTLGLGAVLLIEE